MVEKSNITIEDIKGVPKGKATTYLLPDYAAVVSAKNLLSYVRRRYPPETGWQYRAHVDYPRIIQIELISQNEKSCKQPR